MLIFYKLPKYILEPIYVVNPTICDKEITNIDDLNIHNYSWKGHNLNRVKIGMWYLKNGEHYEIQRSDRQYKLIVDSRLKMIMFDHNYRYSYTDSELLITYMDFQHDFSLIKIRGAKYNEVFYDKSRYNFKTKFPCHSRWYNRSIISRPPYF